MRHEGVAIPLVLFAIVILGLLLSYLPSPYTYDVSFTQEGDVVHYDYTSDTGMETNTVLISNTGEHAMDTIVVYFDESFASKNPWDVQEEMFGDLSKQLEHRGMDALRLCDSESLLEFMVTADPSSSAVLIASGAVSYMVYDGTPDCPLVEWLKDGGTVINMCGCLGKYVSYGPEASDIVEVSGYGEIFAGISDDAFMDSDREVRGRYGFNDDVRDSLHFYMNECTFGIELGDRDDCLDIGYRAFNGASSAVLFRSWEGMVVNFGFSLGNHEYADNYVAQILASGMDYTSEILDWHVGDTRGDHSGQFAVDRTCSVYAYVGSTRAIYAERYDVSSW